MSYINPFYLKYFLDAIQLQSMSRAAVKNRISHPAISQAISAIEKHYDIQLLHRQRRTFSVTVEGYRFAEQARVVLSHFDLLSTSQSSTASATVGPVFLGITRSLSKRYLPIFAKSIESHFPTVQLNLAFGTTGEIFKNLIESRSHLCLTVNCVQFPGIKSEEVLSGTFVLVSSKNFKVKGMDWTDRLVTTEVREETEDFLKKLSQKMKQEVQPKARVASWDGVVDLVLSGFGVGLIPDFMLKTYQNLKVIKVPGYEFKYSIYLSYWPEKETLVQRTIREHIQKLLAKSSVV